MSIEVVLEGKLEKEKDREQFTAFLRDLCEEKKLKMEDYDTIVNIEVCPEGYIECSYEGTFISLAAQTNVAGPGFHAFVCTFFDEVIAKGEIAFEVSDPTAYYEQRNFETLKYAYFYRWLMDIASYVQEHAKQEEELCICWRVDDYQPEAKEGMVVTPMGYIAVKDFEQLEIEDLAERFFLWNTVERTAQYYRSCAMSLLWKDCFYEYSAMNETTDKAANSILDYLEAAYDADEHIALPMDAYHMLCDSVQREPLIHHGEPMQCDTIGYRRNLIGYPFGNWNIAVDGCNETSYDNSTKTVHFMAPYRSSEEPWRWLIKANTYHFEKVVDSFLDMLETPAQDVLESFEIQEGDVHGKAVVEKQEDYVRLVAQLNCETDTLILEYILNAKEDLPIMKNWLQKITHRNLNEDSLKS